MHYTCGGYGGDYASGCQPHYINEEDLKAIFSEYIRVISKRIIQDEDSFVRELMEKWKIQQDSVPSQAKEDLSRIQNQYEQLGERISRMYEDFAKGLLPERQYRSLMEKYDKEQQELERRITQLEEQAETIKIREINPQLFVSLNNKYKECHELTRSMVRDLVEKIVVHSPVGRKPNREQKVEIYFNCIGLYELSYTQEELEEIRLQEEAEQTAKAERKRQMIYETNRRNRAKKRAERLAANDGHLNPPKACPICGKEFWPNVSSRIYCSEKCHKYANNEISKAAKAAKRPAKKEIPCAWCGKLFLPKNPTHNSCSEECKHELKKQWKRMDYHRRQEAKKAKEAEAV